MKQDNKEIRWIEQMTVHLVSFMISLQIQDMMAIQCAIVKTNSQKPIGYISDTETKPLK